MTAKRPLISVLMPVRDGGKHLQDAVDSILAQSLDDLELVLVDDGSRDDAVARLDSLDDRQRSEVEIFACGPHPMLEATAKLARAYDLPCQVSVEEFMACAVGGCAGCVIEVQTAQGPAMKRVCVDGPVFDAYSVFG